MVPAPTWRREEIESINRLSKLIVEEEDPARFNVLLRELDELFWKEQERRARQTPATDNMKCRICERLWGKHSDDALEVGLIPKYPAAA